MTKDTIKIDSRPRREFTFSNSFNESFNGLVTAFSDSLNALNSTMSGKDLSSAYGVCAQKYNLRYITPSDISTFISNFVKALEAGLFHDRISDASMFTVASVKRFIEEHECPSFESADIMNSDHSYINPKEWTLTDLAFVCKNDIGDVSLYSNGEMKKRLDLMKDDVKKINDMHFAANIKNIVKALPNILKDTPISDNNAFRNVFGKFLEEFILFTCTLNTVAVLQLLSYGKPSVEYTTKPADDKSGNIVTECYLYKSNEFTLRNRIPFNFNMRDVVLQDVTPDFKDTHDGLRFLMKDARSPISVLVNKYAKKDQVRDDGWLLSRMLLGCHCQHFEDDTYKKLKNGEKVIGRYSDHDTDGFNTSVTWLDNIAYGNNYLDGNYRRDAMGNNHVHPITNTLDMVYRVFGGVDLKTNEELANNIIRVCNAIRGVIGNYNSENGPTPNYDLTKDVLALLGEIITRDMLHLYYNNTRVIVYTDDMDDAMAPMVMEAFVMEADENTEGDNQNKGTPKPTVTVTNKEGNQQKLSTSAQIQNLCQKFVQWIRNNLSKFAPNFNENHKKEIEWINNNKALNEEIRKAIDTGTFKPIVHNLPKFNVPKDFVNLPDNTISDIVSKYLAENSVEKPNNDVLKSRTGFMMIGMFNKLGANIKFDVTENSLDENAKKIQNWVLYGQPEPQKPEENKTLTGPDWTDLIQDLTGIPALLAKKCKDFSKDMQTALDEIGKKSNEYNSKAPSEQNQTNRDAAIETCKKLSTEVQTLNKTFVSSSLTSIAKKMYSTEYTVYRAIVIAYKQQTKKGETAGTPQEQAKPAESATENPPAEKPEEV